VYIAGDVTVPGSMQLRVDSDLHGKSPQFTLTCNSTGGPATNVTWTRDSEEVLGGVTVLDNAETAQYTHTLTVTGRLPGQYQCTVSNNKPSQDSASIRVKGQCKYNKQYVLQVLSALNCGAQCIVMVDFLKINFSIPHSCDTFRVCYVSVTYIECVFTMSCMYMYCPSLLPSSPSRSKCLDQNSTVSSSVVVS